MWQPLSSCCRSDALRASVNLADAQGYVVQSSVANVTLASSCNKHIKFLQCLCFPTLHIGDNEGLSIRRLSETRILRAGSSLRRTGVKMAAVGPTELAHVFIGRHLGSSMVF